MKKILLSLVVASVVAFAGQGDYKSELSFHVGGVKPEGNLDLENQLNLGLRFGVYVEDKFFDMVEAGFERASSVDYDNSTQDTDINRIFINLIKEYDITKNTSLYGLAGIGYENYRNPMFDNDDDGFFQYGVGLKQWITNEFALKAEVRHGITFDGDNNLFYSLGFVIPFGKRVSEKMPIKSEPIVIAEKPKPVPVVVKEEPKPVVVKIVPKDDDNDGVINVNDKCPTTPTEKVVNSDGCMKIVRLHVNFAYNKSDISAEYAPQIKEVVSFMTENSNYSVAVDGHTDARGSKEYNLALSVRRANAVADELALQGVDRNKIIVNGYGETNPIATNKTEDGRAQNRRVDTSFIK